MIKAVIFDLDGTIADTLPLCIAAYRKAVEPFAGRSLSDEEIVATFGPSEEGTIKALVPQHLDEGLEEYFKYYKELHGMCPAPFEGIIETIRFLKAKKIIVAMVTGRGQRGCDTTLSYYNMTDYFDMIETGSPNGQRKAECINAVMKKFDLKPDEAVYVGDIANDIHASRDAGISVFSAAWASSADKEELQKHKPDMLFDSVTEFKSYLESCIG